MMRHVIKRLKEYFTFTKGERVGLLTLLIMIGIVLLLPFIIPERTDNISVADSINRIETEKYLKQLKLESEIAKSYNSDEDNILISLEPKLNNSPTISARSSPFKPFMFDPNTVSLAELIKMVFTEKQSVTIINYRLKGGRFKKKEDFNILYVVDDVIYKIFESYILIAPELKSSSFKEDAIKVDKPTQNAIELNSADSLELIKVNGIGPVFASRIIKYRQKLGGFYQKEQLMEIWGIDSVKFYDLSPQVKVDTSLIVKLSINTINLTDLKKHPYLNYYLAKAIIDKRIQKGSFKSYSEIEQAINDFKVFSRLKNYISVN